ncbi:MlaC/ttg2D family ABC transporter substrate-binding protein [Gayadomonas joobiniege]|uniref:MlaC/ttg2D family ABC transporter substrate-binding protein n=1 Tax=Gayadomonas joobiniege TaxID=1234606 RepID=UPI0003809C6F|nr:ABC transporter substrate-binding protein [Gayadomonas joobiniege]
MTILKKYIVTALVAIPLLFSTVLQAAQSPNALLSKVGQQLFTEISQIESDQADKKNQLKQLVKNQLLPHIDLNFVSFKLLGKHVRNVKKEQLTEFVAAVEENLSSTYAAALMGYKGQKVIFDEAGQQIDGKYATVKARLLDSSAPAIDLQFKLRQGNDGEWKVYDMVAEGISLLGAKQKEITRRVSEVGLDKVITELKNS